MLKYIGVRRNCITNLNSIPIACQKQKVREATVTLAIAKRWAHQHSVGKCGSNGRRVLSAMNRSMGSHFQ